MGGKGGSKKTTVGYKYSWDIQAGLGRGPVNEVVAITADKKMVFAGTEGQVRENGEIVIDKPDLFGGTDTGGEGGIQGTLYFMFGAPTQTPVARLSSVLSGVIPGFRGMVTTFFSGLISAYSSSPKPWSYRVRRTTEGWKNGSTWYPEKALIRLSNSKATLPNDSELTDAQRNNLRNIHAMNPAHILLEAATNPDWGRGLPLSDIDVSTYKVAADTLYAEAFGLCFRYNRQTDLDKFVQQILDHIGAAQYANLETGLLCLKLIRHDYDADTLPLFTWDDGIIDITDDDSTAMDTAVNEVVVTWHDPVTHSDGEARAQNLGAIANVGTISSSVEYNAIPTFDLAARVAARDLETGAAGIAKFGMKLNRRASSLTPAACFRASLPERGINNIVLRVGKIEENDDGSIAVTVIQDVFGMPATSWGSGNQGSEWQPPDKTPLPVSHSVTMELPYAVLAGNLSAADLSALSPTACFVGTVAQSPSPTSVNYQYQTRAAGTEWKTAGTGDWSVTGTLAREMSTVTKGLSYCADTGPVVGDVLLVDDEILRVTAVDTALKSAQVARGCADTYPQEHAAGALVWVVSDNLETDSTEYLMGDIVDVRLLTRTGSGTLSEVAAPVVSVMPQQRQSRPYPPARVRLSGHAWPVETAPLDEYVLSWSHRDRVLQADQMIDCDDVSIGPEPGTVYRVEIRRDGSTLWQAETTEDNILIPWVADDTQQAATLVLFSVRDGLASMRSWSVALPAGEIEEAASETQ